MDPILSTPSNMSNGGEDASLKEKTHENGEKNSSSSLPSKNLSAEKSVSFDMNHNSDNYPSSPTSPSTEVPHVFEEAQFNKPTFCQRCNGFIWYVHIGWFFLRIHHRQVTKFRFIVTPNLHLSSHID